MSKSKAKTKSKSHTFQPPKGTRDFYPDDMRIRRYIESVWREVSINHGFEEIEGPTFEHLDLYTKKSGDEIVSQLFRFRREGGETEYALRPEFTPTLARMYAAKASSLPSPTKWFCMPAMFRAERPQRGRVREHIQWNADIIGDDSPSADAEIIAVTVGVLERLGARSADFTVKLSHRRLIADSLQGAGVASDRIEAAMALLDRKSRIDPAEFKRQCESMGFDRNRFVSSLDAVARRMNALIEALEKGEHVDDAGDDGRPEAELAQLFRGLAARRILHWCEFDPSIVRGLAYYTGTVFEVIAEGERAVAGGGRYDNLIELFGGPPTPACGFAMGDVVLRLVLEDKGLIPSRDELLTRLDQRPEVFVISTGEDRAEKDFAPLVAKLRREGLHVRHSYRATRNVAKLLGEADKHLARFAVILGKELEAENVILKDLESGEQREVALDQLSSILRDSARERQRQRRRG